MNVVEEPPTPRHVVRAVERAQNQMAAAEFALEYAALLAGYYQDMPEGYLLLCHLRAEEKLIAAGRTGAVAAARECFARATGVVTRVRTVPADRPPSPDEIPAAAVAP